ncbi:uncharacterized protein BDCG_17171 [Blastomyces dermatitidis ER-3]|uniref:Uncharacterized protein n=1 Tax=Ajellomyces dermatitidis (strain ER-3 / ATCC MYA-2586) TaxID=559297 RepID=A0ABX2VWS5_AJEDR|nr:uncharacterized protein BDCG_17171 [Blastomyces dermatitidis ER-3]OAT01619.1 hypothetical protein BDCG_17171 [Blastomyces dermatitidis ER-3]
MKVREEIKLLRVTVSEIKLFPDFSLNDHTESYATVLTERGNSVATAVERAGNELNTDASVSRRDDTSLQGTATTTAAVREAGEDVAMRVMLLRLIDIISAFNLTFLAATEAAAAS